MIKDYLNYIQNNSQKYWFRAKLYGWGWTPARWQGWLVTLVFVGLILLNSFRFEIEARSDSEVLLYFLPQTFILVLLLIIVCYKTGEKPRWQWGPPKDKK
jgi:hypothetical protein